MKIKIPYYSIINIFLPGLMFTGSVILLFLGDVKILVNAITEVDSVGLEIVITVSIFAIAYEVGYVLHRLGAAVAEPILKKVFGWVDYNDFVLAGKIGVKAYEKLDMLSREYGFARTQIALFVVLSVFTGICMQWWLMAGCFICTVLLILTARSFMKKTQTAVTQYLAD